LGKQQDKETADYQSQNATLQHNLAILYKDTQRFTESEAMYKEALEIRRRLAQQHPQAYEPDVATTLNNLANLYKDTQRYTESEAMYKEALDIRRRLVQANLQAYEPDVA
jgi:tetratricopeptide (TPR) repeat protein